MGTSFFFVAFVLAFCSATNPAESEKVLITKETSGGCSFGFELLITKLEMLEQKLLKLDILEQKFFKLTKLDVLEQKLLKIEQTMEEQAKNVFRSCSEEPSKMSGKYRLQPDANEQPFVGFCEQEKFGGGWLVIQHRFDGSVNFYRNWTDYKIGFGKIDGEFWIGLERLHKLTKNKNMTLLVEIEDYDGNYGYGSYKSFEIGNEAEKYVLKPLGEYEGSIDGAMRIHEGELFTTRDSDNDTFNGNCAQEEGGAWWYAGCGNTNPNGPFHKQESKWKKIYWYVHRNGVELKFFRMMIR
ncbi:ryncolin-1-like [Aedes albopictus]|uniref:Fibrinogen C-terminal domain-containing protein n=1 Tax=Aedes albopictus TaxID=7160 RepID=A0ABM1ZX81_AEDAL